VYGALVTAADSTRTGLRDWMMAGFRPRTGPPSAATILRSALWPLAIMSVLHRSIVLPANGNITDDFKPVYRAVNNFRHGLDIYNEHFDYVDPHYLYPPGGTLLMAPFGYLPFTPSRYLFILINTVAILIAWYLLLRLFKYTLSSVAAPALLLAMFCTESVSSTLVFTNINGCVLLAEMLFLWWLLDGKKGHHRDRADANAQTRARAAAVAALPESPVASVGDSNRGSGGDQPGRLAAGQSPDGLLHQNGPVHSGHA
jgi:arabinofuranan 3-O-arabinosyltransferase